jgi:hypothetical protein
MDGDFAHLTHGFSHASSVYAASNLDDDATSIASSSLIHERDNQTINDDDVFSQVDGDDTGSVVGLATRRLPGDADIDDDGDTLAEADAKLPDWACAYGTLFPSPSFSFLCCVLVTDCLQVLRNPFAKQCCEMSQLQQVVL